MAEQRQPKDTSPEDPPIIEQVPEEEAQLPASPLLLFQMLVRQGMAQIASLGRIESSNVARTRAQQETARTITDFVQRQDSNGTKKLAEQVTELRIQVKGCQDHHGKISEQYDDGIKAFREATAFNRRAFAILIPLLVILFVGGMVLGRTMILGFMTQAGVKFEQVEVAQRQLDNSTEKLIKLLTTLATHGGGTLVVPPIPDRSTNGATPADAQPGG